MIIKSYSASPDENFLAFLSFSPEECIFFDIETTGLSWKRSHLYLLGAVFYENAQWIHRQWFVQKPAEEKEILTLWSELLADRKLLIHFNGSTFDVPYLMHRCTFWKVPISWDHLEQLDLYRRLLPCKEMLGLAHMRQKDLENRIGLHREDPFTGGELIRQYQAYLQTADEDLLEMLLLHNREDVDGMLALLPLLQLPQIFAEDLPDFLHNLTAEAVPDALELHFVLPDSFPVSLQLEKDGIQVSLHAGTCLLRLPLFQGTLRYFYPDYKNYYYLPLEDEAIHKSVGAYVDKDHRVQAKADTCYKKITGTFLPQFHPLFTPAFKNNYKDRQSFFRYTEEFLPSEKDLRKYLADLLSHFL